MNVMIEFYEITLILFLNSDKNPKFLFEDDIRAKALMMTFVEQGYETSIKPIFADDEE